MQESILVNPIGVSVSGGDISVTGGVISDQWRAMSSASHLILGAAVSPTMKALANAALVLGSEYDNTTTRYEFMHVDCLARGASAFTSGGTLDIWVLSALDGTNYEDGSASVVPARAPDMYIFLRAVATQQRISQTMFAIPPCKFKILLRNSGGQNLTNTNAENLLEGYFS